jgi:hypothetical protein
MVETMAAAGVPQEVIGQCLNPPLLCPKHLRKHFRKELDTSSTLANASVARRAYQMALTSDNPAWAIFWLKCRAGWKEKQEVQHTGPDGGANVVTVVYADKPPQS